MTVNIHGISIEPDYLFHTTHARHFRKILKDGYLRGAVSFTSNPSLGSSIELEGYTFVFPADIIYQKYKGKDLEYDKVTDPGNYVPEEAEVLVTANNGPVYISDAIEAMQVVPATRKYGAKMKYHYKDIREMSRIPTVRNYMADLSKISPEENIARITKNMTPEEKEEFLRQEEAWENMLADSQREQELN